jgi:hypothetical protein
MNKEPGQNPIDLRKCAILCPHLTLTGDGHDILEAWRLTEGTVVNLDGAHNLFLCEQCYHVIRSHVVEKFVKIYAKAQAMVRV